MIWPAWAECSEWPDHTDRPGPSVMNAATPSAKPSPLIRDGEPNKSDLIRDRFSGCEQYVLAKPNKSLIGGPT